MQVLMVSAKGTFCRETQALLENAEGVTAIRATAALEDLNPIPNLRPDLVLLDLNTDSSSPAELVTTLGEQYPAAKIIVLSSTGQKDEVLQALRQGARGHLVKGAHSGEDLVATLRAVLRGDSILTPALAGVILDEINYRNQLIRDALPTADRTSSRAVSLSTDERARG
jgi:DNA-binding NarL/FixJ family response regulator